MNEVEKYIRPVPQRKLINLNLFRKYLKSIYIKDRATQNRIISYYKLGVQENKRKSYLVQALENMELSDITINNITTYIIQWNARVSANKEL